jgi:nicotinate-nucleotide adenylyltransferase
MTTNHKILIFGGSFSPPTLAHEAIMAHCLALPDFDELWVMPSGDRLDKTIAMNDQQRLAMLTIVKAERLGNNPRLKISDFELKLPRPTQTYQTIQALEKSFPASKFWFVFGIDSYLSMPTWPHGAELQSRLPVVLFTNSQAELKAGNVQASFALDEAFKDVSSTLVRQALKTGADLTRFVSPPIAAYLTAEFPRPNN